METQELEESHVETTISYYPPPQSTRGRGDFSPLESEVPTTTKVEEMKEHTFDFKNPTNTAPLEEEDDEEPKLTLLGQSTMINSKHFCNSIVSLDTKTIYTISQTDSFCIFHPLVHGNDEITDAADIPIDYFSGNQALNGNWIRVNEGDSKK